MTETSEISKFYQLNRIKRLELLKEKAFLTNEAMNFFVESPLLSADLADHLIENQIGQYPLPLGVALNFKVDNKDVVVPMVVEEPSVVAACSNAARFARKNGGFTTEIKERLQTGQIILYDIENFEKSLDYLQTRKQELIDLADQIHPSIVTRGGGVKDLSFEIINNADGIAEYLTIYLYIDVQEAMGANIVNTILEGLAPVITDWLNAKVLMSILSNYNDRALISATCEISVSDLETSDMSGIEVATKIVKATEYAKIDSYRAVTHNKGIMNGIDSVVIATGNDYRAIEAGCHAYASRNGRYQSMTDWQLINNQTTLHGTLTLPMLVGSLGGAISVLPLAKLSQQLLKTNSAKEMASVIVSVGLAQNFAALRALVTDGIQKGHMDLHLNALAIHAGAVDDEIELVAQALRDQKTRNLQAAQILLKKIRAFPSDS